jgi:hypothetical protein
MANKIIPELTETINPASSDVLVIQSDNLTKKIQLQYILPSVADSDTIDLAIDLNSRVISGNVKDGSLTNAKLADTPSLTLKGRKESSAGVPQDLTINEVKTLLGITNFSGDGSPEGVVIAPIGSFYINTSGGANTTLYVKTAGLGNTGWTAK